MPLGVDQKFANYVVVRQLGAGGMGEVYLAQHPRLPRRDALKLLASDVSAEPGFRERFLREADLASTLWHPHIVGVHDRGEYHGQLWISMDYVDGENAGSLVAQRYPAGMPQEMVCTIVTAVASALDYSHKKGLLHRDVKPANILLTHVDDEGEQRILLTDFGIARTVDDQSGLTATNMTVGTVDYTAPEQLMGEDIDGRADQYSLAATAYHLLTGAPPFHGSNPAVVISGHLNRQPPPLVDSRPELVALDPPLAASLAKDPDQRFENCGAFARALAEQVLSHTGVSAPAAPTTPAPVNRPAAATPAAPRSAESQCPTPLSPGWYPDPSGKPGTLYWDGRAWRTASLPIASPPSPDPNPAKWGGRLTQLPWILGIAVALGLVILGSMWLLRPRDDESPPLPAPTASASLPAYSTVPSPRQTPPTSTLPATVAPPTASVVTSPVVQHWAALIVDVCDDGSSCSVKQRNAPITDAPPLHPDDLTDGDTVIVVCQTFGDRRTNVGHGSSYVWYRLNNGAYVSSVYTNIPEHLADGWGMPTCSEVP